MLVLTLKVPAARNRTALAELRKGRKVLLASEAAASSTPAIAAAHGNPDCDPLHAWGHPPEGKFQLLAARPAKKDLEPEYGKHLLLFEPRSGQALGAEARGRLALLAYGGPPGSDGGLRSTQGGVRLSSEMLSAIVKHLAGGLDMRLEIEALSKRPWWRFWQSSPATRPLSRTALVPPRPPLDEVSLIDSLLRGLPRTRAHDSSTDSNDTRTQSSESRDTTERPAFQGGGGQSAGAGASGGWDNAPGAARGVDASGRIVAGTVAALAASSVAAQALADTQHDDAVTSTSSSTAY